MLTAGDIAAAIKGELEGDAKTPLKGVCDLDESLPNHISFLANPRYFSFFKHTKAAAVIVNRDFIPDQHGPVLIRVDDPFIGFITALKLFDKRPRLRTGIHASAVIGQNVKLGHKVAIGPCAVLHDGVSVGDHTVIGSGAVIGSNSSLGDRVVLHPNVSVYDGVQIGNRVTIDSGTVIGADGFGWVTRAGKHLKIPQTGGVVIEDDVWIGVNCCVDRGTFADTRIGAGSKLDNLIQVAHNVTIGKGCLFAGQVGIAGSTRIGDYVTLAGQVGVADHISIGDRCIVASKSAVLKSLPAGSFVSGIPTRNHSDRKRQDIVIQQLPELLKRLRKLERQISKQEGE